MAARNAPRKGLVLVLIKNNEWSGENLFWG